MSYVMSLWSVEKPFHRAGRGTGRAASTSRSVSTLEQKGLAGLVILAGTATLTISIRDPLLSWGYALGVLLLAGIYILREIRYPSMRFRFGTAALLGIALWGWMQLSLGATEYPYGTIDGAVRSSAWYATALVAARTMAHAQMRGKFLRVLAWAGCTLSVVGVLTSRTSPDRMLWLVPIPYPDTWGPFLSRNDFAGFLELSFPAALWLGVAEDAGHRSRPRYLWMAAAIFAGGVASASRAGAILLTLEAVVGLALLEAGLRERPDTRFKASGRGSFSLRFAIAAVALVGVSGAGTLIGRFSDPDPLRYRRDIARSTVQMISAHPWKGYGMGTFVHVYPAFATFDAGATVEHAHNEWLEWAAEGGLFYAALWLILAGSLAPRAVRTVWGLGVMAVFIHALVDYPFARHGLTAWNFALIGALDAEDVREVASRAH